MRRLIGVVFQLVVAVILCFLLTAAWVVFDGLNDKEDKADVGLVTGHTQPAPGADDPVLDKVVETYNEGKFPSVIVIGPRWADASNEDAVSMVRYLEDHGLPSRAIIADNHGDTTESLSRRVAEITREHQFGSVLLVADYMAMTRLTLALKHKGVMDVLKVHVGRAQKEDALKIGREVVTLFGYVGRTFLLPTAEKVQQEAKVGMDKASADAEKAKEKVDKDFNNLAK